MISKPNNWSNDLNGGYLINKYKGLDIITGINSDFEIDLHEVSNKDSIYKTINYLNSIKFSVNTLFLNYIFKNKVE